MIMTLIMIIKNENYNFNEYYRYWGYQGSFIFFVKTFCTQKNTQTLFKYLNTPKKA